MSSHITKTFKVFCDNEDEHFIEQKPEGGRVFNTGAFSLASGKNLEDARRKNRPRGWRTAYATLKWSSREDHTYQKKIDLCPSCAARVRNQETLARFPDGVRLVEPKGAKK